MPSPPSGTIAFLFTDIEGSTRMWEDDPTAMRESVAEHDRRLRDVFDAHQGYVFATGGDGFGVAFAESAAAVAAAVDGQRAMTGLPFTVRMSLHAGSADERDGDYFGPTVNRAARLLEAANGGQVLASLSAYSLLGSLQLDDVGFTELGRHRLRDLTAPETIYQLNHPALARVATSLRTLDVVSNNLPAQVSSFVGRDQELSEAEKLLAGSRLLAITGVGGAGKTRLAVQLAAEVLDDFPDGVWLVELAPVTDPARVVLAVASALGVSDRADRDVTEALFDRLRNARELLILDNCEHVVDAAAGLSDRILHEAAGVKLIATSRELLGVPGEVPLQLRSMAMPAADSPLAEALRHDAVRLFTERAAAVAPGFRVTSETLPAVIEIVHRLDGMPLGLELAAARIRMMSPAQIAARLHDRFRLLTGGSRTALPRQQTLEAAIDWSYKLLDEPERILFRRLSVFQGTFQLESAEDVCAIDPLDAGMVFDLLSRLVDKSLVATVEVGDEIRYRLLETLRQFARERLAESGEPDLLGRRHLDHFRALAESTVTAVRGPEERRVIEGLRADHDNIRRAIRWAVDVGDADAAQATAGSCYRFWMVDDFLREGRGWCEEALALGPPAGRAGGRASLGAGSLAFLLGDVVAASDHLARAVELLTEVSDPLETAARGNYAATLMVSGRVDEAIPLLERHAVRTDDETIALITRGYLAAAYHHVGDLDALDRLLEETVTLSTAASSDMLAVDGLSGVVHHRLLLGHTDVAEHARDLLAPRNEDPAWYPGLTKVLTARILAARGDADAAADSFRAGMERFAGMPGHQDLSSLVRGLFCEWAAVISGLGHHERAAVLLGADDARYTAGLVRYRHMNERYDQVAATVIAAIGQDAFETAREQGRTMTFSEAISLGLETSA